MKIFLLGFLILPLPGAVTISAPASQRSLIIAGVAEGKAASYKNSLWISADADIASLDVVPTELVGPGGPIPVSSVHPNGPLTLRKNVPKELIVSIDTALPQGSFTGKLVLSVSGDASSSIESIPLTLNLTPKPSVVVIPATFAFKATHCGTPVTCQIADWLLPAEVADSSRSWQLSNQTPAAVDWTSSTLILRGDKTGDFIDVGLTKRSPSSNNSRSPPDQPVALPFALPANRSTTLSFDFDRAKMKADHYQGQYRAELGGSNAIVVPFTLDVRDGPLLPFLVLILGIALGRLIQSTNTPRAQAQMRLLDKYNQVSVVVESVGQVPAKQSLQLRLGQTLVDIRRMSRSEAEIGTQLDLVLRLAADSDNLDTVELRIQKVTADPPKSQLLTLLAAARAAILSADSATAEKNLSTIDTLLSGSVSRAPALVAPIPAPPNSQTKPNLLLRCLSWLSGAETINGEWFYSYGRPLMFLLLLILLSLVGLYNSYIKNATFGVEGYFDYLSLFLWGISADVAQKTLQNLSLSRNA